MAEPRVAERKRMAHHYVEDCWYSCPKAEDGCCDERQGDECNCGADELNAYIESLERTLAERDVEKMKS